MSNQSDPHSKDSGSFLTGLGLGLLGGAVGYFLFATDKGDKVRKQLSQEWKGIHGMLHKEEPAKATTSNSLKEIVKTLLSDILEQAQQEQKAVEEELSAKTKGKKKKKLFKGV